MNSPRHLFAYGTLLSRHAPAEIAPLMRRLRRIGKGWLRGCLYDLGQYPGAIPRKTGNPICGEVFELPPVQRVLRRLDDYEGLVPGHPKNSFFVRERWPVTLSSGEPLPCWVYVYKGPLQNAQLIRSGRYLPKRRARQTTLSAASGF